jgi:hypothetical protein
MYRDDVVVGVCPLFFIYLLLYKNLQKIYIICQEDDDAAVYTTVAVVSGVALANNGI